jgi:quinol monooxygenase YgiN
MFHIIWRFLPKPAKKAEFERVYGSEGDWVQLFRKSPGHVRTQLLRDSQREGWYTVIDVWRGRDEFDRFRADFGKEYSALDEKSESLTTTEEPIGEFEEVVT